MIDEFWFKKLTESGFISKRKELQKISLDEDKRHYFGIFFSRNAFNDTQKKESPFLHNRGI